MAESWRELQRDRARREEHASRVREEEAHRERASQREAANRARNRELDRLRAIMRRDHDLERDWREVAYVTVAPQGADGKVEILEAMNAAGNKRSGRLIDRATGAVLASSVSGGGGPEPHYRVELIRPDGGIASSESSMQVIRLPGEMRRLVVPEEWSRGDMIAFSRFVNSGIEHWPSSSRWRPVEVSRAADALLPELVSRYFPENTDTFVAFMRQRGY